MHYVIMPGRILGGANIADGGGGGGREGLVFHLESEKGKEGEE